MRENRKIMIEKCGIKKEFRTMQQAADYIGCSKMLISLVLNPKKDSASIYAKSKTDRPEKISDNIYLITIEGDI